MTMYALFCYKPDGADVCMGCVRESFSSDFDYIVTDSAEELVEFWADILFQDMNTSYGEPDFEKHFLLNGSTDYDYSVYLDLENKATVRAEHRKQKLDDEANRRAQEAERKRKMTQDQKDYEKYLELKSRFDVQEIS